MPTEDKFTDVLRAAATAARVDAIVAEWKANGGEEPAGAARRLACPRRPVNEPAVLAGPEGAGPGRAGPHRAVRPAVARPAAGCRCARPAARDWQLLAMVAHRLPRAADLQYLPIAGNV
ncbi:hypothetical protein QTS76_35540, partial [Micromonospora sp. b486]|nr:hypothetical protein [Micromonospora sp. b486]